MSSSDNQKSQQRKEYTKKNINHRKELSNARSKKKNYLESEHSMVEGDFDSAFKNKKYELKNELVDIEELPEEKIKQKPLLDKKMDLKIEDLEDEDGEEEFSPEYFEPVVYTKKK